jgi:hypothetical protein
LGWFAYFFLFVYFLIILGAALGTFASAVTPEGTPSQTELQTPPPQPISPPPAGNETPGKTDVAAFIGTITHKLATGFPTVTRAMQLFVVWVTAIGLFSKLDLKAWIQKTGLGITAASQYLTFDRRRRALEDQFAALLNHIGEKKDVQYGRGHVVSYSFGSIVALDALFSYDQPAKGLRKP